MDLQMLARLLRGDPQPDQQPTNSVGPDYLTAQTNPMQGYLSATPRTNPLAGYAADALGALTGYASRPDPTMPGGLANPALSTASNLIGLPAVQRTLDRYSYGQPLTNAGKANVPLIPKDTADAAMAVAPLAAKFPRATLGAALGLAGAGADAGAAERAMNVIFKKGTWTDNARILEDGTVEIPTRGLSKPSSEFADKARELAMEKYGTKYPDNYFRFTNDPQEIERARKGTLNNSYNHADGFYEKGLSVADGPHYGMFYKNGYELMGKHVGWGSDGEPLIDPKTVKVLSDLKTSKSIMQQDRAKQLEILRSNGLPDDYLSTVNFLNDPVTFLPK